MEMVGLEGMFSTHTKEYNEVYDMEKYNDILWETHLKTCTDPSLVNISEHLKSDRKVSRSFWRKIER